MGKIHKIADEYYIEFYARGLLYQQKAGSDFQRAEELLATIEAKIASGELQTVSRDISIDVFFNEFLKHARTQYHPHTVRRLELTSKHFENFLQKFLPDVQKLSQANPRVFEEYKTTLIKELGQRRSVVNSRIVNLTILLLREILEQGIKIGYINDNPTLHIKLVLSKASRGPLVSAKDFEKILDCSSEPYRSIFSFLRSTGLKIKELEYLTWQQVDFHRNVIFVKYREIPLNAPALSILKNAFEHVIDHKASVFLDLNGRSFESFQLEIYFAEAVAKAQLGPEVSIASLRDAFARDLLSKRLSFLMVGKILGIHDIAKLMYYSSSIPLTREDVFTGAHGA